MVTLVDDLMVSLVLVFTIAMIITYLFHQLKIAPIAGYLIAGVILGPSVLDLITGSDTTEFLAEIGILLLLFLIGVELSLEDLMKNYRRIAFAGLLQIIPITIIVFLILSLLDFDFGVSLFIGLLISFSSTAIVLQALSERGEINSSHGQLIIGILIFQDLIVVIVVLSLPIFVDAGSFSNINIILNIGQSIVIVLVVLFAARLVIPFILAKIVKTRIRELFLLALIMICFGTAYLTYRLGLSLVLGAFIAGLVISESEYGNQVVSELLPLKDIFSILFFISIGLLIDVSEVFTDLRSIFLLLGLVSLIILTKMMLTFLVPVVLGYPIRIGVLTGVALAQIGEFSFILAREGLNQGLISRSEYQVILIIAIISMILTPTLINNGENLSNLISRIGIPEKLIVGRLSIKNNDEFVSDRILKDHVIIVGYGVNGKNVSKSLQNAKINYVVIELNPEYFRNYRETIPIVYGDASREHVLKIVNINQARAITVLTSDATSIRKIVDISRRLNPSIHIIARTRYLREVEPLYQLGANHVIPEEFETSIEITTTILKNFDIPDEKIKDQIHELRKDGYNIYRNMQERIN